MKVDELVEARDTLEHVLGVTVYPKAEEILSDAVEVLNNMIGCEPCHNRGWVVRVSKKNGMGLILACDQCMKGTDHKDIAEAAVSYINQMLMEQEWMLETKEGE